mmetsp:Transcript_38562/g.122242  ORF Transcript_38562/g.122242 Transcript_38562/m.122242 type:complete len:209 (-) Transcript_38562:453-1079(-)
MRGDWTTSGGHCKLARPGGVGRTERGHPYGVCHGREVPVREHGHVAEELVDHVGLRGVHWVGVVPHVLCAVEGLEGQPRKEVPRVKQPSHGADLEARRGLEHCTDILELRNVALAEAKQGRVPQPLLAGVLIVQGGEPAERGAPGGDLGRRVRHTRDRGSGHMRAGEADDVHPSCHVGLVTPARVPLRQLRPEAQDLPLFQTDGWGMR